MERLANRMGAVGLVTQAAEIPPLVTQHSETRRSFGDFYILEASGPSGGDDTALQMRRHVVDDSARLVIEARGSLWL